MRNYLWACYKMSRPSHLVLIALVFGFGTTIASAVGSRFNAEAFFYGLLVLMPASASVHYANEYADYESDFLTVRTRFSGGSGALQASGLPRRLALICAWAAVMASAPLALIGWAAGLLNNTAAVVLALSTFFGWMYSLPPLALAWHGWGELANAVLGGVLLPMYGYSIQTGRIDLIILLASLPFGLLVFLNLLATTWPDQAADAAVGKGTLATRWPEKRLRRLFATVAVVYTITILSLMRAGILPTLVAWSSLLVIPLVVWGALVYTRRRSPFPSVAAMVVLLLVQTVAWWVVV